MSRLPKAPLQEVIFEIRWRLEPYNNVVGQMHDPGFELASGRLSNFVEEKFPVYKKIIPPGIPEQLLSYKPVHQYWSGIDSWPVLQLGPGIFTINCTDQVYDWEDLFRPLIQESIGWLNNSYKEIPKIIFSSLRYIDAINIDEYGGMDMKLDDFIEKNFNFSYKNSFNTRGIQQRLHFDQSFITEDKTELQIQFSSGTKNNKPAILWQTAAINNDSLNNEDLLSWADKSHKITHNLFKEIVKPNLYASFSK